MTVREWLESHVPTPPAALQQGVFTALGNDLEADAKQTTEVCLQAAQRALRAILEAKRFHRDGAVDLLVVDALTTYAYEYAGVSPATDLRLAADDGVRQFGHIAVTHG